jgi:hypothetical protein
MFHFNYIFPTNNFFHFSLGKTHWKHMTCFHTDFPKEKYVVAWSAGKVGKGPEQSREAQGGARRVPDGSGGGVERLGRC